MIVLLDLNYTLVSNSEDTRAGELTLHRIRRETYRTELLERLQQEGHRVFLVTARPSHLEAQTLESIWTKTVWRPERNYFNARGVRPPMHKAAIADELLAEFGEADLFLALESNPRSRAEYAKRGIRPLTWQEYLDSPGGA